jgi:hypothetical protein
MIRKIMVLMAGLFLLSPAITFAADFCAADNNGDCKVDLTDLVTMKSEFLKPDCEACSPPYPAPVAKTGQATSYATGDDGDLEKGVAWPNPRFTDNGNGTVTDNLTGLIWLKNANCFGLRNWDQAVSDCNALSNGSCELTDGSSVGDWRLPNRFELESLLDLGNVFPALPSGHPFVTVQPYYYWSSTTYAYSSIAWYVDMSYGGVAYGGKGNDFYVWPVRGPE